MDDYPIDLIYWDQLDAQRKNWLRLCAMVAVLAFGGGVFVGAIWL